MTAARPTPSGRAAVLVSVPVVVSVSRMNAQLCANMFDETLTRLRRAVADLRRAIADGTATDPKAAAELAERMERYVATANDNPVLANADLPLFPDV